AVVGRAERWESFRAERDAEFGRRLATHEAAQRVGTRENIADTVQGWAERGWVPGGLLPSTDWVQGISSGDGAGRVWGFVETVVQRNQEVLLAGPGERGGPGGGWGAVESRQSAVLGRAVEWAVQRDRLETGFVRDVDGAVAEVSDGLFGSRFLVEEHPAARPEWADGAGTDEVRGERPQSGSGVPAMDLRGLRAELRAEYLRVVDDHYRTDPFAASPTSAATAPGQATAGGGQGTAARGPASAGPVQSVGGAGPVVNTVSGSGGAVVDRGVRETAVGGALDTVERELADWERRRGEDGGLDGWSWVQLREDMAVELRDRFAELSGPEADASGGPGERWDAYVREVTAPQSLGERFERAQVRSEEWVRELVVREGVLRGVVVERVGELAERSRAVSRVLGGFDEVADGWLDSFASAGTLGAGEVLRVRQELERELHTAHHAL
ncbi:hypothetical protein ACWD04_34005, partial [Streptomyces sp. NPDC002911]